MNNTGSASASGCNKPLKSLDFSWKNDVDRWQNVTGPDAGYFFFGFE
jgi:hypothetical protein